MPKLRFLCTNHRAWLRDNPHAAASTWSQAYSQALELREEQHLAEALRYAGAAFETADLLLNPLHSIGPDAINRFSQSATLLMQLLYLLNEGRLARAMLNAAIRRLDLLSNNGSPRRSLLEACQQLMTVESSMPLRTLTVPPGNLATYTSNSAHIH